MDKDQRKYDRDGLRTVGLGIAVILAALLIAAVIA